MKMTMMMMMMNEGGDDHDDVFCIIGVASQHLSIAKKKQQPGGTPLGVPVNCQVCEMGGLTHSIKACLTILSKSSW